VVEILNSRGQVVYSLKNNDTIQLGNLDHGLYILKVTTDRVYTKPFLKLD